VVSILINQATYGPSEIGNILTTDLTASGTVSSKSVSITGSLTGSSLFIKQLNCQNTYEVIWTTNTGVQQFIINSETVNVNSMIFVSIVDFSSVYGFPQAQVSNIFNGGFTISILNIGTQNIPSGSIIKVSWLSF
jgi:hypothetical protein